LLFKQIAAASIKGVQSEQAEFATKFVKEKESLKKAIAKTKEAVKEAEKKS